MKLLQISGLLKIITKISCLVQTFNSQVKQVKSLKIDFNYSGWVDTKTCMYLSNGVNWSDNPLNFTKQHYKPTTFPNQGKIHKFKKSNQTNEKIPNRIEIHKIGYFIDLPNNMTESQLCNENFKCKFKAKFTVKIYPSVNNKRIGNQVWADILNSNCPLKIKWNKFTRSGLNYIIDNYYGGKKFMWFKVIYWRVDGLGYYFDKGTLVGSKKFSLLAPMLISNGLLNGIYGLADA